MTWALRTSSQAKIARHAPAAGTSSLVFDYRLSSGQVGPGGRGADSGAAAPAPLQHQVRIPDVVIPGIHGHGTGALSHISGCFRSRVRVPGKAQRFTDRQLLSWSLSFKRKTPRRLAPSGALVGFFNIA